ncbi:hypothetical protein CVD28_03090 [Bacillus sp. M6-12]|uniref:hypothetical protein n=1 Tax=Bacillus sp. M6-12 TaxID=2054166 RepID=UPI000C75DF00|nr:hypothetical protein [Bacillus sp. M6-12]PLS19415.1 hypothetical protein CVD28_03090 [Bacillus sp. M6-12]
MSDTKKLWTNEWVEHEGLKIIPPKPEDKGAEKVSLTKEQVELMEAVNDGATIFGYKDAKLLREVQKQEPTFITIIDNLDELARIEGKRYKGNEQLPYFGAVITEKGQDFVKEFFSKTY